jgi:hypothetical protein
MLNAEGKTPNETVIEVADTKVLQEWNILVGICECRGELDEHKAHERLPGFALASALVSKALARAQTRYSQAAYKYAAQRGIDVANASQLYLEVRKGKVVMVFKPMDLVNLAESGE